MTSILDFIKRHLTWIIIGVLALVIFMFLPGLTNELKLLLLIPVIECIAIALSGVAMYAYTKIKFDDAWESPKDSLGKFFVMGCIFIGVHLLTAGSVFGMYFVLYSGSV